jgi:hypothetical protein
LVTWNSNKTIPTRKVWAAQIQSPRDLGYPMSTLDEHYMLLPCGKRMDTWVPQKLITREIHR